MTKPDVAQERKDQIVRATVECISRYGYHNFSMQDVAKTAGVSKGIIHYYFLNKDDLMMSVLSKVVSDIGNVMHSDMDALDDPIKKLEIFIEVCSDIVRSTREYYQVSMDFWTQINQKEDVRKVIAMHYVKFRDTCTRVLEEGMEKGVFNKVNSAEYSSFIIASIDGMSLQWLFDSEAFDYDKIVKQVTSWIINGILLKSPS